MEEHPIEHKNVSKYTQGLASFSPKQTFILGLVGGVLVLCTIGFFVLLGIVLKGGIEFNNDKDDTVVNKVAEKPSKNSSISLRAVDEKTDHIRGNKKAKIAIVTYSDLECPFCKRFHETMFQIMNTYGDDIKWIYRHLPLDNLHSKARSEALASECAGEQGKFWEFVDIIFEKTTSNDGLDLSMLPAYAKQAGADVSKFNKCYESKKFADKIKADEVDAQSAGGQGTPYSVIVGPSGELVPISGAQPFTAVEAAIKQFLK